MEIIKVCPICSAITKITVDNLAYRRWKAGALIQNVMPDMSIDERESLISGLCKKCQADFFNED